MHDGCGAPNDAEDVDGAGSRVFLARWPCGVVLGLEDATRGPTPRSWGRELLELQRRMRDVVGLAELSIERDGHVFRLRGPEAGPERTLDLIDMALPLGFTVVDELDGEVNAPTCVGERGSLERAIQLVRGSEDGFMIVEGGPDLAYYLQAIRLDGCFLLEAAGPDSMPPRHRKQVDRLRWLGFTLPHPHQPNARRPIERVEDGEVASICVRALTEVYGLPVGAPLRLKLAGV